MVTPAKISDSGPTPTLVTLVCITDGHSFEHIDDGVGKNTGYASPGRNRILEALKKVSRVDGEPLFLLLEKPEPPAGMPPIFTNRGMIWGAKDDKRLKEHLKLKDAQSRSFKEKSRAAAEKRATEDRQNEGINTTIAAAVKAAVETVAAIGDKGNKPKGLSKAEKDALRAEVKAEIKAELAAELKAEEAATAPEKTSNDSSGS